VLARTLTKLQEYVQVFGLASITHLTPFAVLAACASVTATTSFALADRLIHCTRVSSIACTSLEVQPAAKSIHPTTMNACIKYTLHALKDTPSIRSIPRVTVFDGTRERKISSWVVLLDWIATDLTAHVGVCRAINHLLLPGLVH
jgi:hypothetical protein